MKYNVLQAQVLRSLPPLTYYPYLLVPAHILMVTGFPPIFTATCVDVRSPTNHATRYVDMSGDSANDTTLLPGEALSMSTSSRSTGWVFDRTATSPNYGGTAMVTLKVAYRK